MIRRSRQAGNNVEQFFTAVRNMILDISRHIESHGTVGDIVDIRSRIRHIRNNCQRMTSHVNSERLQEIEDSLTAAEDELGALQGEDNDDVVDIAAPARGGRRLDINEEQLQYLLRAGFSVSRIAREGLLGRRVHRNTIRNCMSRSGISHPRSEFNINDEALRQIIQEYIHDHPNSGSEEIRAYLRVRDVPVFASRNRVRSLVAQIDPAGVATRWSHAVTRRRYSVPVPNSLWHIDSHHSIARYGIYIHGCIDGNSRLVTYLKASSYNTSKAAFESFLSGVNMYGVPSRIRIDGGVENGIIKSFMVAANGEGRGSFIEGRSCIINV